MQVRTPFLTHPPALVHRQMLLQRHILLQNRLRLQLMARMANSPQVNVANQTVNTTRVNVRKQVVNTGRVRVGNAAVVNTTRRIPRFPGRLGNRLLTSPAFASREAALTLSAWYARFGARGLNPYAVPAFASSYASSGPSGGGYSGGGYGGGGGYPGGGYGTYSPGLAPYGSNPYSSNPYGFGPSDYDAYLQLLAQSQSAPATSAGQTNPYAQPDPPQDQGTENKK
jgi:hypothetical protein